MEQMRSLINKFVSVVAILLILLVGVFLVQEYQAGHFNSIETFQAYIASYGLFAPVILVLVQGFQVVFPVLPGFLGCIVGASMFGAAGGFWCNYIGISAGSIIAFFLARKYGSSIVKHIFSTERYDKYAAWILKKKSYTIVLFLAILLPLAPDDFLCYFTGLTKMSARKFIGIIILAKPWCILVYCLFFDHFI